MAGENAKVHKSQNPDKITVESGGEVRIKSGGSIIADGGSTVTGFGTAMSAAAAVPDLGASGAGTANDTLQAVSSLTATATVTALRDEINAVMKPQLDNNFEDIRAKLNAILATLRTNGLIST